MRFEDKIRQVTPYVPGEQPDFADMIKLNTNENPYPPSPKVQVALKGLPTDSLRLYPDPDATALVRALAAFYGVQEDQLFVGVGSDDVLAMAFLAFFNSGQPILFPDITYSFYDVWANLFRIPYKCVPLDDSFRLQPADYFQENGGIVIANPNAPTSVCAPLEDIEAILQHNRDVIVIVDEAYVDFGGTSALSLLPKYDNLVVVQTFSKSRSLAGMRIGFAIASPQLIRALNDVKASYNSYTMNRTAIAAGVAAVEDRAYFEECCRKVMDTRETARARLAELGFSTLDSCTNFLFATHARVPAQVLFEELKKRHIFVRYFNKPRIDNYLRISIGTDEQMEQLYKALKEILQTQ